MNSNLLNDSRDRNDSCNLCNETVLTVGEKTNNSYAVIYKIGELDNGWFATLSPRTGGDPEKDFTVQLMPFSHLTHFSQINSNKSLAHNYGTAFAKLSKAMTQLVSGSNQPASISQERNAALSIASYWKCTNWIEKKEHLHQKIFPFRGNIGQPYTVDSSFGRKEIFKDEHGKQFIKMYPVIKKDIPRERFEAIVSQIITLLQE
jgi:hypothetical protein